MDNSQEAQEPSHQYPPFSPQHRPEYEGAVYKPAGKLEGRRALITGGDSGLGRAVAVLFAREGADVAIVYDPEGQADAQETASAVEDAGRRCVLIPGDVSNSQFCEGAAQRVVDELGSLDVLVNGAAYQSSQEALEDISDEQLERTFRVNVFGYFYMARAALKHMAAGGSIINTGSMSGFRGDKMLLDYASTKGAVAAFTKSLAANVAEREIRVNCVAPGVETERGREAQPEEIAPAYVYFASSGDSGSVTGETLLLPGGERVS